MNMRNRLNAHFAACAVAAVGAVAVTQQADAAIVYSGVVNINIPVTTAGVYLNVVTGVNATTPAGAPGWDVNPWSTSGLGLFNPAAPAGGVYVVTAPGFAANLAFGTLIDGASTYGSGTSTNVAQWNLNSSNNIVGFRFQNEANGNQTHYGWMRISLGSAANAAGRAIVEYAYEDVAGVGIAAGAGAPAPGALALLGLAGVVGGRRRRAA